jgi:hypothetical protein
MGLARMSVRMATRGRATGKAVREAIMAGLVYDAVKLGVKWLWDRSKARRQRLRDTVQ